MCVVLFICVVEDVFDFWVLERVGVYCGGYYVIGGILFVMDGIGFEDLNIDFFIEWVERFEVFEVIFVLNVIVDG